MSYDPTTHILREGRQYQVDADSVTTDDLDVGGNDFAESGTPFPALELFKSDKSYGLTDTTFTIQDTIDESGRYSIPSAVASRVHVSIACEAESDAGETVTFRLSDLSATEVQSPTGASFEPLSSGVVSVDLTTSGGWSSTEETFRPHLEAKVSAGTGVIHGYTVLLWVPL